ncbi:Oligopeptide transport ATP-binding protein OppF [Paraliobacillus sp. PM-2]|uniref:ATP-binding cassette domain-containing protein n=1 Tax=Paraliobacillus sp. PM-2 TaxID=1462524 RepID=UPI00061BC11F|nr:ATP-binding cassette domain-containing protein [Paraliobacillus sp. PM-2]CQR46813.1 Oligopeptide transport ATP-binding protein OppF [Paraliobacillus sp. PM-2]
MVDSIIEVKNLTKTYKVAKKKLSQKATYIHAVKDVSFQVFSGETFGIVGESGSGKSTIAHLIMGINKMTDGKINFKGRNITHLSRSENKELYRQLQIVFQDPYSSLNPKRSIEWILTEPLIIHKIGTKEWRKKRVIEVLEEVGLGESYLKKMPHELSGGQRQRVVIASALILQPEVIIIDEGVSSLDVSIQASILNLLNDLKAKHNLTYIFISHDLNVVQYFCDRIAVVYLGEFIELFHTEEYNQVEHADYTEKLFNAIPSVAFSPLDCNY